MKKVVVLLTAVMMAALMLAGCTGLKSSEFSLLVEDDSATITAKQAKAGDYASAGSLVVGTEDTLLIEPQMEGDAVIHLQMYPDIDADEDATLEELTASVDEGELVVDTDIGGTDGISFGIPAGEYMVTATVVTGGTGTIQIRVEHQE